MGCHVTKRRKCHSHAYMLFVYHKPRRFSRSLVARFCLKGNLMFETPFRVSREIRNPPFNSHFVMLGCIRASQFVPRMSLTSQCEHSRGFCAIISVLFLCRICNIAWFLLRTPPHGMLHDLQDLCRRQCSSGLPHMNILAILMMFPALSIMPPPPPPPPRKLLKPPHPPELEPPPYPRLP